MGTKTGQPSSQLTPTFPTGTEDGDMRLVNGASANEGRVEIFYRGQWGTVCDNLWNILDANVVCRALGYENATRALGRAAFGPGVGCYDNPPEKLRSLSNVPQTSPLCQ